MRRHIIMTAILSAIIFNACSQSLENTYSNQETRIDSFLGNLQKSIFARAEQIKPEDGEEGYDEKHETYMEYLALLDAGMGQIVHTNSSNRITLYPGTGNSLTASGKATIYYALYIFNGNISASNLVYTNSEQIATESRWEVTSPSYDPITVNLSDKNMIRGLSSGLQGAKEGEECYIVFSGKYGYGNKSQGTIPANSALLYHIKVLAIE